MAEKIAGGFRETQGPAFSRLGYLLFSDTPAGRILKWEAGKVTVARQGVEQPAGLTFDHQGRLLACERGRVTRTEKNGSITVLAAGMRHPRDVVYSIDGGIYFTDGPALHQITRQGAVRVAARDFTGAAAVALAPNQLKVYVADSARIHVYDVEGDGRLRNGRVFAEAAANGLKTDEQGKVWAAAGNAVTVFSPAGERGESTPLPEPAANLNWGEGFHNLYVTAGGSVYRLPVKVNGTRTY